MAKIAFIGLGNMGGPMAANLLAAGHEVAAFDLVPETLAALAEKGARAASSALDACDGVEYVISMLPAGKHVASLYTAENGLIKQLPAGTCILDCSTIDAQTARDVAVAAEQAELLMMDSPVSGGVAAAAAGTLAFMCGGSSEAFEKAKVVLSAMGKNIFHAGGSGAGQVAKMCNNMLLSIHMIGTSEALAMGAKNGLDAKVLSEIMLASSGRNWSLEVYNPYPDVMETAPASNDYKPGFMVDLMCKDLGLAMDAASASDANTPMGTLAAELYKKHQEAGNGAMDFSSILKLIES
jgi:3-hydroxyisobutyrate dehydrogenase